MVDPRFSTLVEQMRAGVIDRRTFLTRAAALGISSAAIMRGLPVAAQDSTPEASSGGSDELTPENLGMAGVEHSTDTSKGEIKLYSSWPMSGASEQIGGDSAEAVKFAVEIWGNAAGGFAITYEALDDGLAANNGAWDAAKEAENASRVVNDENAVAYIATYNSGAAEAAIPITNEAGLAQISPANTAVQLTKENPANPPGYPDVLYPSGKRNYMRVVPADDLQGAAGANFAFNTLGAKKAYVIHDQQTYGRGLAEVFQTTFKELGGEVAGFEGFDANAPEYQALMTKIANAAPDLLYLGAIVNLNASKLLQDMRNIMSPDDVAFMGPDGLVNQAFIDGAGDAAEGALITFAGLPANQLQGVGKTWYEQFKARLGHEPDAYALYSFEAAVVALQAIDAVGEKDRAKILDAMMATKEFRGLIGTWSFTETGDTDSTTVSVNNVKDGVITFQETITPPQ
ncbi:MAG TPA: branched-chain amino acid ABC transporter substrate-binding protein [Thermomicrobiales bacterium]|nr:branched-chain amino acid ABC transporter substrate-binding protein [Thermomicrobiales bacterium]